MTTRGFWYRVARLFLTLGMLGTTALGNTRTHDTDRMQIEGRLVPKRKTINAGEPLEVRVEIGTLAPNHFSSTKTFLNYVTTRRCRCVLN